MTLRSTLSYVLVAGLFTVAACQQPSSTEAPAKPAEQAMAKEGAKAEAPKPDKSHPECVGPIETGTAKTTRIAGVDWERNGSTLQMKANKKEIRIGALTDIKENSPENLANIDAFLKWFKKEKVDMIVVAGDSGLAKDQLVAVMEALGKAKIPVFNIVGNREGRSFYTAAMQEVEKKMPHVFNLNQVRRIDTPAVDIISLPGYWNPKFLHADDGDGCQYFPEDVAKLGELVKASDSPVLLVSHGGPKQSGAKGIELTTEAVHAGDPAMAQFIADQKIPFGIFGNIHEAGGHATDLKGEQWLKEGMAHDAMYLNPGPTDGVRWEMNDKTVSVGMAAVVSVKAGKASYKIHRLSEKRAKMAGKK